jgi:2Fe-2S ferredoxin
MAKIVIQPAGITIEGEKGASLMEAAQAQGYYWPSTCGGEGRCTTCTSTILSGGENLSAMGRSEQRTLISELGPRSIERNQRLACQARLEGDGTVEVDKAGVRLWDDFLNLSAKEPES